MLRKLFAILFIVITMLQMSALWADSSIPDVLSIKQSSLCYRCVSIMDQSRPFAFLQHDAQNWDVFYYFDADKQKQLTIKKRGASIVGSVEDGIMVVFFDILDNDNRLIAKLRLYFGTMGYSFFSFEIISSDDKYLLIESRSGLTGTETAIYDRTLGGFHEIAQITRPLFTWSLNSELHIIDKQDLLFIMDPNLFYAAVALNANTELFYSIGKSPSKKRAPKLSPEILQKLRKEVLEFASMRGITLYAQSTHLSVEEIAAAEHLLLQQYAQMSGTDWNQENLDKGKHLENLIHFGCDYLLSHSQSQREEYAMLQFLSNQLG